MAATTKAGFYKPYSGAVSDVLLTHDGSEIYVASANDVWAIQTTTGQIDMDFAFESIAGMDFSENGRFLTVATFRSPYGTPEIMFFRIDTTMSYDSPVAAFTAHILPISPATGITASFRDVAMLSGNIALFSQAGTGELLTFDFSDETIAPAGLTVASATLIPSPDHTQVLILDDTVFNNIYLYDAVEGVVASRTIYPDPYAGASAPSPLAPIGAISPTGDHIFVGSSLLHFDGSLKPLTPIAELGKFGGALGMTFNASGDQFYLYTPYTIVVFDTDSWEATATYGLSDGAPQVVQYGNTLTMSGNGRFLAATEADGVEVIDLAVARPDSTAGNDTLVEGRFLYGLAGNDTLGGGAGTQGMFGGKGNDSYYIDDYDDQITELAGEGYDRVFTSVSFSGIEIEEIVFTGTGNASLVGGNEANVLRGAAGADELQGNGGADELYGAGGADLLNGGAGADRMEGGQGNDIYIVDNVRDQVTEAARGGVDTVMASIKWTLGAHQENLQLTGPGAINGTGNDRSNVITGNGNANLLFGLGGNDILDGGGGNDRLDGGSGVDIALFSQSHSSYSVSGSSADNLLVTASGLSTHLLDIEILRFSDGDYVWDGAAQNLVAVDEAAGSATRLVTSGGFMGDIGGSATVFGTLGFDDITVLAQSDVVFDPSFNRGGDVIRFEGSSEGWSVALSGSSVTFDDGLTTATIPIGATDTFVVFDDGARTLRYDAASQTVLIGNQAVTPYFNVVAAAANVDALPSLDDEDAVATLYMAGGSATVGGDVNVIGSALVESVTVNAGTITFDPSFNRGGDTITLPGAADQFTAATLGSSVVLTMDGMSLTIPVGLSGLELEFNDGERELLYDSALASVLIGSQPIGADAIALFALG